MFNFKYLMVICCSLAFHLFSSPGIVIVIIATFLEVPPDVADSIIYFPEESFVRMMQMISFPLMFSSVLVGELDMCFSLCEYKQMTIKKQINTVISWK